MFSVAPKQVEPTNIIKKGRKNKEVAQEHFEASSTKIENVVFSLEGIIKLSEPTLLEVRKQLRVVLRETKEIKKLLTKYRNIQYKPKRTRESHNTGLEKLRPISENMALFAEEWEYGVTQKSRYDVTNLLCAYIKNNELRDPNNRTIITPDAKLKKLLQVEDDIVLKYPTMQKYLKNCFEEPPRLEQPNEELSSEQEIKRGRKPKELEPIKEEQPPVKEKVKKELPKKKEPKTKK